MGKKRRKSEARGQLEFDWMACGGLPAAQDGGVESRPGAVQGFQKPVSGCRFQGTETLMKPVASMGKHRLNRGADPGLHFYRDSAGSAEVDWGIEDGSRIHPLEIKASSTYDGSMARHLKTFLELCPEAEPGLAVYAGETFPSTAANYSDTAAWSPLPPPLGFRTIRWLPAETRFFPSSPCGYTIV